MLLAQNEIKFLSVLKTKIKQAYTLVEKERKEKQDLSFKVTELENQLKSISIKSSIQSSIEKELQSQRKESLKLKLVENSTQTEFLPHEQTKESNLEAKTESSKLHNLSLDRQYDKHFEITQNSIEVIDENKIIPDKGTMKRSSSIDKLEKIRKNK